ncbi:superoxide dismutase [Cu-Zn] [Brachionus plicatilis]|uniref:Superoxide dismutase [Cu-Zn] n=1 Tax=Brachionus plicatilis TaxID=10195 RepID=A0A3M7P308_BRAPC|nr:superoxide dismutase [Cu-Zn] [Brachionus plicatilis]
MKYLIFLLILSLSSNLSTNYQLSKKAFAIVEGEYEKSHIRGHVIFKQLNIFNLHVMVHITGIPSKLGPRLGFHVHKNGILNPLANTTVRCESAGPHYNPLNRPHGNISSWKRHVGDYGNMVVHNGTIKAQFVDRLTRLHRPFNIIGRTVVLHEREDDLGLGADKNSKINGNSGPPIACGMIGVWS